MNIATGAGDRAMYQLISCPSTKWNTINNRPSPTPTLTAVCPPPDEYSFSANAEVMTMGANH